MKSLVNTGICDECRMAANKQTLGSSWRGNDVCEPP